MSAGVNRAQERIPGDAGRLTLGILGQVVPPTAQAIEGARQAEVDGFDSVWWPCHLAGFVPDALWTEEITPLAVAGASPHTFLEPFTMLSVTASVTERLRLGTSVTDILRRHPAMLAQLALTVDHLSEGRLILGLGSGEAMNLEPYGGIAWDKPVSRLEEALQVIRLLWEAEGPVDHDGRFYPLRDAVLGLQPYEGVAPPIWLAAHGPRMLEICGRYGDGWLPTQIVPETYAEKLAVIRESAKRAGRDPDAITPSMVAMVLCAPDEESLQRACESPLVRLTYVAAEAMGRSAFHTYVPTSIQRADAERLVEHISPEAVRKNALCGTPEQVVEQLREFEQAGLRDVVLMNQTPLGAPDLYEYSTQGMSEIAALVSGTAVQS